MSSVEGALRCDGGVNDVIATNNAIADQNDSHDEYASIRQMTSKVSVGTAMSKKLRSARLVLMYR
jgi:hypothetical protein